MSHEDQKLIRQLFFHKFFSTKLAQKDAAAARKKSGKGREDEDMLLDDFEDEMSGAELPASVADEEETEDEDEAEDEEADDDEEEEADDDEEEEADDDEEPGSDPEEDEIWKVSSRSCDDVI